MSDTSGQPDKSAAPKAKSEGSELLDEGFKAVFFDLEDEEEGTTSYSISNSLSDIPGIPAAGTDTEAQEDGKIEVARAGQHGPAGRRNTQEAGGGAETCVSMEQQLKRACQEKQQSKDLPDTARKVKIVSHVLILQVNHIKNFFDGGWMLDIRHHLNNGHRGLREWRYSQVFVVA
ncbi:uncharacterized protein LOC121405408 [Drosophila obscura]|uniref:uncharacterized protein LOC121405408 n=1 Tax=Drosophila obscura TaxID=7282 RepID=UPI001BB1E841|nr:uncharacterized protein LOC121405408 [Drosophila obscura]